MDYAESGAAEIEKYLPVYFFHLFAKIFFATNVSAWNYEQDEGSLI